MPKDTKTLGNNKARACESLGFVHKKRLCQRFDTTSSSILSRSPNGNPAGLSCFLTLRILTGYRRQQLNRLHLLRSDP